ncbi:MAG: single-stranded DNA-binding protein [Candidatus Marinimicrobia bacterium]|nr:single-stranded DNA-binding protein [Candidatus Neomarinimicrobiota bacterium]
MQRGSVNKVILVGHIGGDPEVKYTPSGTAVVNLTLATNEVRRDKDGNDVETTEWHRLVVWGKQAEFAGNYVKKGQLLFVEGRLQTRKWEDRSGAERRTTEIVTDNLTMLGSKKSGSEPPAEADAASQPPDDDDIPF